MESRVAVISIILENSDSVDEVNKLISSCSDYIVGRMGLSVISVVIDSPQDVISTLSGQLGKLKGVSAKTAYSKYIFNDEKTISEQAM